VHFLRVAQLAGKAGLFYFKESFSGHCDFSAPFSSAEICCGETGGAHFQLVFDEQPFDISEDD
jgi:hypothetical protein